MDSERDGEIFSDNESRIEMIDHVVKTRLLPILIIFLCCVLPNFIRSIETNDPLTTVFTVFFAIMTLLYSYLIVYCGLKLRKLRKNIEMIKYMFIIWVSKIKLMELSKLL